MTVQSALSGESLLIQIGNGATPEVFTHPCLINTTRSVVGTANMSAAEIADCGNPSAPGYMRRVTKSIDWKLDGEGIMDAASVYTYLAAFQAGLAKNVRVLQNVPGSAGGWQIAGSYIIDGFTPASGVARETQTCKISLAAAGPMLITQNAG